MSVGNLDISLRDEEEEDAQIEAVIRPSDDQPTLALEQKNDLAPRLTETPKAPVAQPARPRTPLQTFSETDEYQMMSHDARVEALAQRDPAFAELLRVDAKKAGEFAEAVTAFGSGVGFKPSYASSISGGLERGIGYAVLPVAGALQWLEDRGLIETDLDEDALEYAHQRIIDGQSRIGTDWEHQLAGMIASLGTAIVPAAAATAAAAAGGAAVGVGGVPLAILAQTVGLGSTGYFTGYAEGGEERAQQRGAVDVGLGVVGGVSMFMPRLWRAPVDFSAGLIAGKALGLPFEENMVQAMAMATIGGVFPQARPSGKILAKADIKPDSFPGAAGVLAEARSKDVVYQAVKAEMERELDVPIVTRDMVEIRSLGDAMRSQADDVARTPVAHWPPQDLTPAQNMLHENRIAMAAEDARPVKMGEATPEMAVGWNPGWRHQKTVQFGQSSDRISAHIGEDVIPATTIMRDFAAAMGFTFERGNVRSPEGKQGIGYHWAKARDMKVLRRDDLQTMAHEWGHDTVVTDKTLRRYVHKDSPELKADLDRLRTWLAGKEADAGTPMTETGLPSKTVFKYKDEIPDDLKYIEELMAMSYDRADLAEGFAETMRVYTTNSAKYGGDVQLDGTEGVAPALSKILDDWVDAMPDAKKAAFEKFSTDATKYVRQDGLTTMYAMIGNDASTTSVLQSTLSRWRQNTFAHTEGAWNMVNRAISEGLDDPKAGHDAANLAVAYIESAVSASRLTDLSGMSAVPRLIRDAEGNLVETAGTGKSLLDILNIIGPSKEMQKSATLYFAGRRGNELWGQAYNPTTKETMLVSERVAKYITKLRKKKDKTTADTKLIAEYDSANASGAKVLRHKVEDQVLDRVGDNRREMQLTRDQLDQALGIVDNPRYAHLEGAYEELKKFWREVEQFGSDAGLFTKQRMQDWEVFNSEYAYPWKRDMSDQLAIGGDPSHGNVRGGTGVSQLTGLSGRPLADDWLPLVLGGIDDMFRRASENIAKQVVIDTVLSRPEVSGLWFKGLYQAFKESNEPNAPYHIKVGAISTPKGHTGTDKSVFTVYRDGKPYYYDMADEGAIRSMQFITPPSLGKLMEFMGKVKTFRQEIVTMNPDFFLPALVRDMPSAFLFSKTPGNVFKKAAIGFRHAWQNTPEYHEYIATGSRASLTNTPHASKRTLMRAARKADSRVARIMYSPGDAIGFLRRMSNSIEASTRMGEVLAAKKMGIGGKRAAYLGTRVQPNFQSHGTSTLIRGMGKLIPFFQATTNAVDRLAHWAIRDADSNKQIALRFGSLALASITMEEVARRLMPNYDDLPRWLKMAYHIIPEPKWSWENGFEYNDKGELQFELTLIPKNHETGLVANVATRMADEFYSSSETGVASTMVDSMQILLSGIGIRAMGQASPLPLPVIVDEATQALFNWDSFSDSPIENMSMTSRRAYSRIDTRTPEIYKMWGALAENMTFLPDELESPKMAQWLIEQIFGQFAVQGTQLTERWLNPTGPAMHSDEYAILRRFQARADKYSKTGSDFWENAKELTELNDTMKFYESTGDIQATMRHYEKPGLMQELFIAEAYRDAREEVASFEEQIRFIRQLEGMDRFEKRRAIDELRKLQRAVQYRTEKTFGKEIK